MAFIAEAINNKSINQSINRYRNILLKTIRRKVDCCFRGGSAAVLRGLLSKNLAPLQALAYLSAKPPRQGPLNPGTLSLSIVAFHFFDFMNPLKEGGSHFWLPLTQQRCVYIYRLRSHSLSLPPPTRSFAAILLHRNLRWIVHNHGSRLISPQLPYYLFRPCQHHSFCWYYILCTTSKYASSSISWFLLRRI
jgi:hypothetical protein